MLVLIDRHLRLAEQPNQNVVENCFGPGLLAAHRRESPNQLSCIVDLHHWVFEICAEPCRLFKFCMEYFTQHDGCNQERST